MNQSQMDAISTQIVAINDAIQILARSNVSVQQHSKEIDGLLQKTSKNDERLREIESLIHQSCDLKTKEMADQKKDIHKSIDKAAERSMTFTKYVTAAISAVGLGFFYYMINTVATNAAEHTDFEARQEEKNDKIFNEIFGVMREIRTDVGSMKSNLAVLQNNQVHYQNKLKEHMEDEERDWKWKK